MTSTVVPPAAPNPDEGAAEAATVPPTRLSVELHLASSVSVLRLTGELDADSLVALDAQIDQLAGAPCRRVIVELSLLRRIDRAGCDRLVLLARSLRARGGELSVAGASGQVAAELADAPIGP